MSDYFEIVTPVGSEDHKAMVSVINRGIDSWLEAFTFSQWQPIENKTKVYFTIHTSELQILIRRLLENGSEEAEALADDIVTLAYDVEIV